MTSPPAEPAPEEERGTRRLPWAALLVVLASLASYVAVRVHAAYAHASAMVCSEEFLMLRLHWQKQSRTGLTELLPADYWAREQVLGTGAGPWLVARFVGFVEPAPGEEYLLLRAVAIAFAVLGFIGAVGIAWELGGRAAGALAALAAALAPAGFVVLTLEAQINYAEGSALVLFGGWLVLLCRRLDSFVTAPLAAVAAAAGMVAGWLTVIIAPLGVLVAAGAVAGARRWRDRAAAALAGGAVGWLWYATSKRLDAVAASPLTPESERLREWLPNLLDPPTRLLSVHAEVPFTFDVTPWAAILPRNEAIADGLRWVAWGAIVALLVAAAVRRRWTREQRLTSAVIAGYCLLAPLTLLLVGAFPPSEIVLGAPDTLHRWAPRRLSFVWYGTIVAIGVLPTLVPAPPRRAARWIALALGGAGVGAWLFGSALLMRPAMEGGWEMPSTFRPDEWLLCPAVEPLHRHEDCVRYPEAWMFPDLEELTDEVAGDHWRIQRAALRGFGAVRRDAVDEYDRLRCRLTDTPEFEWDRERAWYWEGVMRAAAAGCERSFQDEVCERSVGPALPTPVTAAPDPVRHCPASSRVRRD